MDIHTLQEGAIISMSALGMSELLPKIMEVYNVHISKSSYDSYEVLICRKKSICFIDFN